MNVFISYRRNDSQDLAGRLADRIRTVREIENVFIDVDGIEPGVDFECKIDMALTGDPVFLVLIGPDWLGRRPDGAPARIHEPRDFVRREVATALSRELRVLPVLGHNTEMPQSDLLPEELRRICALNAVSIRHATFERDVDYLIEGILRRKRPGKMANYLRRHPALAAGLSAVAGIVLAAFALILAGALHAAALGRSLEETLGGEGQVWLLIVAVIGGGACAGFFLSRRRRARIVG